MVATAQLITTKEAEAAALRAQLLAEQKHFEIQSFLYRVLNEYPSASDASAKLRLKINRLKSQIELAETILEMIRLGGVIRLSYDELKQLQSMKAQVTDES